MSDARVEVDYVANARSVENANATIARGIQKNADASHAATRQQLNDLRDLERSAESLGRAQIRSRNDDLRSRRGFTGRTGDYVSAIMEPVGVPDESTLRQTSRQMQAMRRYYEVQASNTPSAQRTREILGSVRNQQADRNARLSRPYSSLGEMNESYRQIERRQQARNRQARLDAMNEQQSADATSRAGYASEQSRERTEFEARMRRRAESRALPWNAAESERRLARIQSRRGGMFGGNAMSALGREASILGSQFGLPYLGLGMGVPAAALGIGGAAGFMAYRHHEEQVTRREGVRTSVNDPVTALRNMRMNFDFSNLNQFEQKLFGISNRWGVSMTEVAGAAADALSAGGSLAQEKILGAVNAGSAMFPRDSESSRAVSGGIMDIMKIASARGQDISPEAVGGFLVQMGRANRAVSLSETAKWGSQALSTVAMSNPSTSLSYLAQLYSAITQMAPDPTGRTSRTGFVRLNEALQEWKPEGGPTRHGTEIDEADATRFRNAKDLPERLAVLQQSQSLQAAFWEGHDFEAPVKGAIQAIVSGSKLFTDSMTAAARQIDELNEGLKDVYENKLKQAGSGHSAITEEMDRSLEAIKENLKLGSSQEQRHATARKFLEAGFDGGGFWTGRKWLQSKGFDLLATTQDPEAEAIRRLESLVIQLQGSSDRDKDSKIDALKKMIEKLEAQREKYRINPGAGDFKAEFGDDGTKSASREDLAKERKEISDRLAQGNIDPMHEAMLHGRVKTINDELTRRDAPQNKGDQGAAGGKGQSAIRAMWRNRMLKLPGISNAERAFLAKQAEGMTDEELAEKGGKLIKEAQGKEGINSDKDRIKTGDAFKAWGNLTANGDRQVVLLEQLVERMDMLVGGKGTPVVVRPPERRAPGSNASLISRS